MTHAVVHLVIVCGSVLEKKGGDIREEVDVAAKNKRPREEDEIVWSFFRSGVIGRKVRFCVPNLDKCCACTMIYFAMLLCSENMVVMVTRWAARSKMRQNAPLPLRMGRNLPCQKQPKEEAICP